MKDLDFLTLPVYQKNHGWHLFMPRIVPEKLTISRNIFIDELIKLGIGIFVHYIPLHIMPYYKKKYAYNGNDFPETMKVFNTVFSLPIYPDLTEDQLNRIVLAVRNTGLGFRRKT